MLAGQQVRTDPSGVLAFSLAGGAPAQTTCFGAGPGCTGLISLAADMTIGGGASGHLYVAASVILDYSRSANGGLVAQGCLGSGCAEPLSGPGVNIAGTAVTPDDGSLHVRI